MLRFIAFRSLFKSSFPMSIFLFSLFFLLIQCFTRLILAFFVQNDPITFLEAIKIFSLGTFFDGSVLCFFLLFPLFYYNLTTTPFKKRRFNTILSHCILFSAVFMLVFTAFAECIFWEEFSARFNFIAVDYLIYTTEVIRNIHESYNLTLLMGSIIVLSFLIVSVLRKLQKYLVKDPLFVPFMNSLTRIRNICLTSVCVAFVYFLTPSLSFVHEQFSFQNHRELAQNGIFSFVSAFFNNSLDYNQFYLTKHDLKSRGIEPLEKTMTEEKTVSSSGPLKPHNVILVLMESMSAEFMSSFGNKEKLTPYLDTLADKGIFFTRMYATGTRTVRGIEAITLAFPPAPGQAIIKRAENENLISMGTILRDYGYNTAFIYGGNSYFDNMGHFFGHNGFEVIDRSRFTSNEIQLENAWGVCDEDLFHKVLKEADLKSKEKKPFMFFALTTSNHRPYLYPSGKIDLAPKVTGRSGGVKYADFAVGEFIRQAKTRPWFQNTLFIFVADHTHGTTGRLEITPEKHHIPCLFYAPSLLSPQKIDTMVSQIDVMPTLLGLLNIPFDNGIAMNVLKQRPNRAFISNFQKLGYLTYSEQDKKESLTILKPVKDVSFYENGSVVPSDSLTSSPLWEDCLAKAVHVFSMAAQWKKFLTKQ